MSGYRAVYRLVLLLGLALLIACAENPVDLPEDVIIDPSNQDRLQVDTIEVSFDTTYSIPGVVNTVDASVLLMGRQQGVEMYPIIKFLRGEHSANNVQVLQAEFKLLVDRFLGDTTTNYSITVYPIIKDWSDNTSPIWQDVESAVDFSHPIGFYESQKLGKDTITISLIDTALVRTWSDTNKSDQNYGVYLDFQSDQNFLIKFRAGPEFRLTYMAEGDTAPSVDSTYLTRDAYVIQGTPPELDTETYNYVMSLFPRYMVMSFDLAPLREKYPDGIIISSGEFILPIDTSASFIDPSEGVPLRLRAITSDPTVENPEIDSSRTVLSFDAFSYDSGYVKLSPGTARKDFASLYLQQLLEDPQAFTGVKLDLRSAANYFAYIAFRKHREPLPGNRPRLLIYYWIPPETGN